MKKRGACGNVESSQSVVRQQQHCSGLDWLAVLDGKNFHVKMVRQCRRTCHEANDGLPQDVEPWILGWTKLLLSGGVGLERWIDQWSDFFWRSCVEGTDLVRLNISQKRVPPRSPSWCPNGQGEFHVCHGKHGPGGQPVEDRKSGGITDQKSDCQGEWSRVDTHHAALA